MSEPVIPKSVNPAAAGISALPSRLARGLAVLSILIGGLCGGLIGFALTDVQCTGDCTTWKGIGILVGAVGAAIGIAIVAVLTLRAMDEWDTLQKRGTAPRGS